MQNPFTTTFSKIPDNSYIPTSQAEEIIENFRYDNPSESVYKITGVRGSGKTVLLAKIEGEFNSESNKKAGWLVCRISPARDMLQQLASFLVKEGFTTEKKKSSVSVSAGVLNKAGSIGISTTGKEDYSDVGVDIDEMLKKLRKKGKKVLIGIDEVSKTDEMVVFASEYGKWLRENYPIYMVCTGLYENIEQLSNVKNLTFFRRATTIMTEPLNVIRMTEMYRAKLGLDTSKAKKLAESTKGYAYAFQELGVICFKSQGIEVEDAIEELKTELYAYSYEKIWEELSEGDKKLARELTDKLEYKREEVLPKLDSPSNYSVYRDRLKRRGIVRVRQGYISLALPFFADYIKEYC